MTKTQAQQRAAWVFGSLSFVFLLGVFCFAPVVIDPVRQKILAIISAILVGLFGYFLTGSVKVVADADFPQFGKVLLQAGGGTALAIVVLLWWLSDRAPVKTLRQSRDEIIESYNNQILDNL